MTFVFHSVRRYLSELRSSQNWWNVRNEQIQIREPPHSFYVA